MKTVTKRSLNSPHKTYQANSSIHSLLNM